jgi:hypothetical protein
VFTYQAGPWTAPLTIYDLFFGVLLLVLFAIIGGSKKRKMLAIPGNEHYKYYSWNIWGKIFLALAYGAIYMFYYQGGDTMAYWQGAEKLNNLMWASPTNYVKELFMEPSYESVILHFNAETGFPPMWIYRDPGSFSVSKLISLFMIFVGQSYVALSIVFGYITAIASWRIYELVLSYKITSTWLAALAILFVPSVSFWCAGVSKDTVVLIAVFMLLYHLFQLANKQSKNRFKSILWSLVYIYILYNARSFMLFTVFGPLFLALNVRIIKQYRDSVVLLNLLRIVILSMTFVVFILVLRSQGQIIAETADGFLKQAEIQQSDFQNNETYGEKRYDLGITDYSPIGMLRKAPVAILTAFYRPGIWEANSPLLLISGLETSLFIVLTAMFLFKGKLGPKIRFIRFNEFLVFSLGFALILAFFAGFTSGLFGVLVRFKAPLLPFLLIVLTTNPKNEEEEEAMEMTPGQPALESTELLDN